jgi:Na+/melibiose symporter-like transporter
MAITYPGDLYASYGLAGIVLGMFLLGVVCQALTNTIAGRLDKRRLFVYAAMFMAVSHLETDAFSYLTSLLKTFVMLSVVALVIYGVPRSANEAPAQDLKKP